MHVVFEEQAKKIAKTEKKQKKTIQEKAQEMIKSLDDEQAAPIPEEKLSRKTLQKRHKKQRDQLAQSVYQ